MCVGTLRSLGSCAYSNLLSTLVLIKRQDNSSESNLHKETLLTLWVSFRRTSEIHRWVETNTTTIEGLLAKQAQRSSKNHSGNTVSGGGSAKQRILRAVMNRGHRGAAYRTSFGKKHLARKMFDELWSTSVLQAPFLVELYPGKGAVSDISFNHNIVGPGLNKQKLTEWTSNRFTQLHRAEWNES